MTMHVANVEKSTIKFLNWPVNFGLTISRQKTVGQVFRAQNAVHLMPTARIERGKRFIPVINYR